MKPGRRAGRPEAAAIGDFDPYPGDLDDASTATMLAKTLAPIYTDEVLTNGISQVADELAVLAHARDSRSDIDLAPSTLYAVVTGYENRLRVLSTIARKALLAVAEERAA